MKTKEGEPYFHIVYPKYKLGEEVVREVAVPPSYGMTHANIYRVLKSIYMLKIFNFLQLVHSKNNLRLKSESYFSQFPEL